MDDALHDYYGLQLALALQGDSIALRVACDAAAIDVLLAEEAPPPLARVLAGVAGGLLSPAEVEQRISDSASLTQAVVDLGSAQLGDLTMGSVAGRDLITINVYVGEARP